jgi:YidC/Oxa1 family membrane protein insertase
VTLTWDNAEGLFFTRTVSVDENYMLTLRDAVKNSGTAPVKLSSYGLISRTGTPQVGGYYILHEGLIGYLGDKLREVGYSSLDPAKPNEFTSTGGWLGFTDKYG